VKAPGKLLSLEAIADKVLVEGPLPKLRRLIQRGTAVYVPTHLSNMDSIVFGYALVPRADGPTAVHFEHDAFRLHARLSTGGVEYRMTVVQGDVEIVARRL